VKLVWSNLAREELSELRRYSVERWGRDVALRYLEDVRDAAKRAADRPEALRPLRGMLWIKRVRSHYLIVHVDEPTGRVTIARVLHTAMDVDRHLP